MSDDHVPGYCSVCGVRYWVRDYHGTSWALCDECFGRWEAADFKRLMDPANATMTVGELHAQVLAERQTHPDYAPLHS